MKTITEYQPLIFSALGARAGYREQRNRRVARGLRVILPLVYGLIGLKLGVDTGMCAWDLGFWIMMLPVILLGEQLLRTLAGGASLS
jgi:hypothetical protein